MAPLQKHLIFTALAILNLSTSSHAGSLLQKRGLIIPTDLLGDWTSEGCYTDSVGARTLTGATYNGNGMTDEACVSFCDGKTFAYAGTEYAGQCYCGNSLASTGTAAAATDCNMACTGNSSEACGGPNRLNIFYSASRAAAAAGPFTNPGPPGWQS